MAFPGYDLSADGAWLVRVDEGYIHLIPLNGGRQRLVAHDFAHCYAGRLGKQNCSVISLVFLARASREHRPSKYERRLRMTTYRYAEMTWSACREAAYSGRVAVLPVATYEDHGYHLPIDTDVRLCTGICERAVARIPDEAVLIPPVSHGYSPHHMDFPGTITIRWDTFINYVRDVCVSLAHHGFKRILIVNGHGSNTAPVEMAARLTVLETEGKTLCASVNHWGVRKGREEGECNPLFGLWRYFPRRESTRRPSIWPSPKSSCRWTRPWTSVRPCRRAFRPIC